MGVNFVSFISSTSTLRCSLGRGRPMIFMDILSHPGVRSFNGSSAYAASLDVAHFRMSKRRKRGVATDDDLRIVVIAIAAVLMLVMLVAL